MINIQPHLDQLETLRLKLLSDIKCPPLYMNMDAVPKIVDMMELLAYMRHTCMTELGFTAERLGRTSGSAYKPWNAPLSSEEFQAGGAFRQSPRL